MSQVSLDYGAFFSRRAALLGFREEPKKAKHQKTRRSLRAPTIRALIDDLEYIYKDYLVIKKDSPVLAECMRFEPMVLWYSDEYDDLAIHKNKLTYFDAMGTPTSMSAVVTPAGRSGGLVPMISWALKEEYAPIAKLYKNFDVYHYGHGAVCTFGKKNKRHLTGGGWYVGVHKKTGEVRVLRELVRGEATIRHKGGGKETIRTNHWRVRPYWGSEMELSRYKEEGIKYLPDANEDGDFFVDGKDGELLIRAAFIRLYNIASLPSSGMSVVAKKKGLRVSFTVPQHEWKYFFKDRIDALAADGKKRRIFHWVSAHIRKTNKGETPIKTHFKGSRRFKWKGFGIHIFMSGYHGPGLHSMGISTFEKKNAPKKIRRKSVNISQYSEEVYEKVTSGWESEHESTQ